MADRVPKDILVKKSRGGESFINRPAKKASDPMTPGDLVHAVFDGDPKALLHSFGAQRRERRKKFLKDKAAGKAQKLTLSRNKDGTVSMEKSEKKED